MNQWQRLNYNVIHTLLINIYVHFSSVPFSMRHSLVSHPLRQHRVRLIRIISRWVRTSTHDWSNSNFKVMNDERRFYSHRNNWRNGRQERRGEKMRENHSMVVISANNCNCNDNDWLTDTVVSSFYLYYSGADMQQRLDTTPMVEQRISDYQAKQQGKDEKWIASQRVKLDVTICLYMKWLSINYLQTLISRIVIHFLFFSFISNSLATLASIDESKIEQSTSNRHTHELIQVHDSILHPFKYHNMTTAEELSGAHKLTPMDVKM